jgi:nucleotide-binding universal stress UspA family protein
MNGWQLTVLLLGVWVLAGLASTAFMLSRGHRHPLWYVWGLMLGPLAAPVLAERAEHTPRLVEKPRAGAGRPGLCVLVGVDDSPGSRHVAEVAWQLLGERTGRLILTSVVSQDSADIDTVERGELGRAHRMLLDYARELSPLDPCVEVVAGAPVEALLDLAHSEGADVIVVGPPHHRRGVFGVCRALLAQSPVPVLVAHSAPDRSSLPTLR